MSPLAAGRVQAATTLDAVLRARWDEGDDSVSNVALAERFLGVTEKAVRKWRDPAHAHDKPVPLAALFAFPDAVVDDLVQALMEARGLRNRSPLAALRAAAARVEQAELSEAELAELRALHVKIGAVAYGAKERAK